MRTATACFCVIAMMVLAGGTAFADKQSENQNTPATPPGECPVGYYWASKISVNQMIPDNDPAGLCTPEITFNASPWYAVNGVVIDLDINHTWVGDLVITLTHTSSTGEVRSLDLLDRPGVPETTFGCSGDLVSDPEDKYYFGGSPFHDLEPMGEFDCPAVIEPGCYAIAIENSEGFYTFGGVPCGDGAWQLCITDNGAGDAGTVFNWSVHLRCDIPVSTEATTWGRVKALYRTE